MEAKEKGKELVDKYINVEYLIDFDGMTFELAKECALIAVDEILNNGFDFTDESEYWHAVKTEIEKL